MSLLTLSPPTLEWDSGYLGDKAVDLVSCDFFADTRAPAKRKGKCSVRFVNFVISFIARAQPSVRCKLGGMRKVFWVTSRRVHRHQCHPSSRNREISNRGFRVENAAHEGCHGIQPEDFS